jgi:hypothetical protein
MHGQGGYPFLGIGGEAPAPDGHEDAGLKKKFDIESQSHTFRCGVILWLYIIGNGNAFDWAELRRRLSASSYRGFSTVWKAIQSLGWAGVSNDGRWLFGVFGHALPIYGSQAIRHELFHAIQDFQYGLFSRPQSATSVIRAEFAAHTFGSPIIGIPLLYGGIAVIIWRGFALGSVLFAR